MSKNAVPGDDVTDAVNSPDRASMSALALIFLVGFVLLMCWLVTLPFSKEAFAKVNASTASPRGQGISTTIIICGAAVVGVCILTLPRILTSGYDKNVDEMNKSIGNAQAAARQGRQIANASLNEIRANQGATTMLDVNSGRELDGSSPMFEAKR